MKKVAFIALFCVLSISLLAQIPQKVSFQGHLQDYSDGTMNMRFTLYDSEIGGTLLWTEEQVVSISDGVFSVMLGEMSDLSGLEFDMPYWLDIEIAGETLSPRYELSSSPYAFRAQNAEAALYAEFAGIASFADSAGYAEAAGHAETADNATMADTAMMAFEADTALFAENAETAETATTALTAGSVSWDDIDDMPPGFADGVDDVGSGGETYSAGAGIAITGTEISIEDGGITPPMLSDMGAGHNQVLKYDAGDGSWVPANDLTGSGGDSYTAGAGIDITGDEISIADAGITSDMLSDMDALPGQIMKYDPIDGWTAQDDETASSGSGLTEVATTARFTGDGTSGDPLDIADGAIDADMLSDMDALPGQVIKYDPVDGWTAQDDETASGGSGLTEVATTESFAGDGTSGDPLDIADGAIGLDHIDDTGSADGQIIKNVGGSLVWASDAGGEGSADDDWTIAGDNLRSIPEGSVMIGADASGGGKLAVTTDDNPYTVVFSNTCNTYNNGTIYAKSENDNNNAHGIISHSYYYGTEDHDASAFRCIAEADSMDGLGRAYGAYLRARASSNSYGIDVISTSHNATSYGISSIADGESTNYGIYAEASGGTENWAGYFLGDVNINGDLTVSGEVEFSGSIPGDDWGDDSVNTDYTLIGDGTPGNVLGIAEMAIQPDHIDPSAGSHGDVLKISSGNVVWASTGVGTEADEDWDIIGDDLVMMPSGNVAIGTEFARANLHIYNGDNASAMIHSNNNANLYLNSNMGNLSGLIFQQTFDTTAAFTFSPTFGGFSFWNGGDFMMPDVVIDTIGRMGIGTITPDAKIQIDHYGHGPDDATFVINKQIDDSLSSIVFRSDDTDFGGISVGGETLGGSMVIGTKMWRWLHLKTNDIIRMTIDQEGMVGIGTIAPTELLDVNGNVHIAGNLTVDGTYPGGGGGGVGGSGTDNYIARWDGTGDIEASDILANDDGSIEIEAATTGGYVAKFINTASGIKSGVWAEGTGGIGIYAKSASDNTSYAALKGVSTGGAPALHATAGTGRAGYFNGDVHVEGELTTERHTSPAGPIAYGVIYASGTISSATSNVSCSRAGTIYQISVDGESIHYSSYVIIANAVRPGTDRIVTVSSGGGNAQIQIYDVSDGTTVEADFSFVIYKP